MNPFDHATVGALIPVLGAAAVLLVAAVIWRGWARWRSIRHLRVALASPNAATRIGAVRELSTWGMSQHARIIYHHARVESDVAVLDAIAAAVDRHGWEPTTSKWMRRLRQWARSYPDGPPNRFDMVNGFRPWPPTRADLVGPHGPGPVGTAGVAVGAEAATGAAPRDVTDDGAGAAGTATPTPIVTGAGPSAPGRATLVVTGAGGPAGEAVVRALGRERYRVVAVDCDDLAAGGFLAEERATIPAADDPDFGRAVTALCERVGADGLVCTVAEEMPALYDVAATLAGLGVRTWLPHPDALTACTDKARFVAVMEAAGVPVPATRRDGCVSGDGPWIVKPRFGRGSRGVLRCEDRRAVLTAMAATADPIVQELAPGREFTADCLVAPDGTPLAVVPRWRLATRGGIATRGQTFADARCEAVVRRCLGALGLTGAANVQGFVADDGTVRIIEVNPRFAGGLPISQAAGCDLVGAYVELLLGRPVDRLWLEWRPGTVVVRYLTEVVVEEGR